MVLGAARGHALTVATLLLVLLGCAAAVGAVLALGSDQLTLIAAGAIGGLMLLFVPTPQLAATQLLLSLVGAGVAMYYLKVGQAHWLPYALALWIWLKLPIDALARVPGPLRSPDAQGHAALATPRIALLTWVWMAWLAVALASAFVNLTPPMTLLVGARNHLFIWSLAFAIAAGTFTPTGLRRAWLAMLVVAALQLPFAVQQHYMNFGSIGSWDTVVGTFGGDPEGGGASGAMVIYQCIALGVLAALWKRGQLTMRWALALALAILGSIAMAEVKAFFVFAPLVLGAVFLRDLRERPWFGIAALLIGLSTVAGVFAYYKLAYFDGQSHQVAGASVEDYLGYIASADSRLDLINRRTGEVSRLGAPLLWAQETAREGPVRQLVGFGLRASRTGGLLGAGEAARHYAFNLTTSAVTVLLWELGLAGLATFVALLVCATWLAMRLARDARVPEFHRAVCEAVPAVMLVLLASCLYNDAAVNHFTIQTTLAFVMGHLLYWRRQVQGRPALMSAGRP